MFRNFMRGRYGLDRMGFGLLIAALAAGFISMFCHGVAELILILLQAVLIAVCLFRALSRNIYARQKENNAYLRFRTAASKKLSPLNTFFKKLFASLGAFFRRVKDREHKYFRCPNCKNMLRVPKGRGYITVTCPKCGKRFDKKS